MRRTSRNNIIDGRDANNTLDTINAAAFAIASSAQNRVSQPPNQV